jgi:hypothetical protein
MTKRPHTSISGPYQSESQPVGETGSGDGELEGSSPKKPRNFLAVHATLVCRLEVQFATLTIRSDISRHATSAGHGRRDATKIGRDVDSVELRTSSARIKRLGQQSKRKL